jgi:hypothetical protein
VADRTKRGLRKEPPLFAACDLRSQLAGDRHSCIALFERVACASGVVGAGVEVS